MSCYSIRRQKVDSTKMDSTTSGYASMSDMTNSQIGKLRIGAGARQRRRDKYRIHMNQLFEDRYLAALESFKQHFDTERFREEKHRIACGIPKGEDPVNATVEIDETIVDKRENVCVVQPHDENSSPVDDNSDKSVVDIMTAQYSIKQPEEDNIKDNPTDIENRSDTSDRVKQCSTNVQVFCPEHIEDLPIPTVMPCLTESVELESGPKSPSYAPDSPKDTNVSLEQRLESVRAKDPVILIDNTTALQKSEKPVIKIHPLKYSIVVLSNETSANMVNFEKFMEECPLGLRKSKTLDKFIPRAGCVFQTSSMRTALYLKKRGVCVIAHVNPIQLQKKYGCFYDTRKLRRNGVLTFVSINRLDYDISICYDRLCLISHRFYKHIDKQKGGSCHKHEESCDYMKRAGGGTSIPPLSGKRKE